MERYLMQYEKEAVRKTMLKHEETFKEQIQELHRLYQVQKLLMNDVKNKEMRQQEFHAYSRYATKYDVQRELTYQAPHPFRTEKMIDLEFPAEGIARDHIQDFSADGEIQEETDTELTLRTGGSNIKRKKEEHLPPHRSVGAHFSAVSTKTDGSHCRIRSHPRLMNSWDRLTGPSWESFRHEQKSHSDEEIISRQKGQPLWLFPVLSLNIA